MGWLTRDGVSRPVVWEACLGGCSVEVEIEVGAVLGAVLGGGKYDSAVLVVGDRELVFELTTEDCEGEGVRSLDLGVSPLCVRFSLSFRMKEPSVLVFDLDLPIVADASTSVSVTAGSWVRSGVCACEAAGVSAAGV